MNKALLGGFAVASALLWGATAHAASPLGFNAVPDFNATGSWNVSLTPNASATSWNVIVHANGTTETPSANARNITITFADTHGTITKPGGPNGTVGAVNWTQTLNGPWLYLSNNLTGLNKNNSNFFSTTINLTNPFTAGTATVRLGSGLGNTWVGSQTFVTPEMPGSVLALASLLPLVGAVVIRRRGHRIPKKA